LFQTSTHVVLIQSALIATKICYNLINTLLFLFNKLFERRSVLILLYLILSIFLISFDQCKSFFWKSNDIFQWVIISGPYTKFNHHLKLFEHNLFIKTTENLYNNLTEWIWLIYLLKLKLFDFFIYSILPFLNHWNFKYMANKCLKLFPTFIHSLFASYIEYNDLS
jgi:hypothetical protein